LLAIDSAQLQSKPVPLRDASAGRRKPCNGFLSHLSPLRSGTPL